MALQPGQLVRRFYDEVWNHADEAVAREILHSGFRFRASLGPERVGPEGFIGYLRSVHAALQGFTCIVEELVVEADRAAARMTFFGTHAGRFFDVAPTGREIRWSGGAFFHTDGAQITALWVLGDVDAVKRQLGAAAGTGFALD